MFGSSFNDLILSQSEYVSERDKRREFVSGFSGSAGMTEWLLFYPKFELLGNVIASYSPAIY